MIKNYMKKLSTKQTFLVFLFCSYTVIYWKKLIFGNLFPVNGDILRLFYPSWAIGKMLLLQSSLLWDPFRCMGQPFLASPIYQPLYPIRFLSLFFDFGTYQIIYILFHIILAGGFGYLLGLKLFKNQSIGFLFLLGFGFNGTIFSLSGYPPIFASMAWLPCCLYLLLNCRPYALGISLALQWMAGYPTISILTGCILFLFFLIETDSKGLKKCLFGGGMIGAGLAAIQWIPFLELLRESARPLILDDKTALVGSIPPLVMLKQLVLPFFCNTNLLQGVSNFTRIYFGPVIFVLALIGVWKGFRMRNKRILVIAFSGAFFLMLAIGYWNPVYAHLPLVKIFRSPSYWMIPFAVVYIYLAGVGLMTLKNSKPRILILIVVGLDLLMFSTLTHFPWFDNAMLKYTPHRLVGLGSPEEGGRLFHTAQITDRSVHWFPRKTQSDWILLKGILTPSYGTTYGFRESVSHNNMTLKRNIAYGQRLNYSPVDSPLFDFADIKMIIALTKDGGKKTVPDKGDFGVIQNENPKGRAFFVEGEQDLSVLNETPGEIELKVRGEGSLVFSETYYPGWKAEIDGQKVPIKMFEENFMQVEIPEGADQVRFFYSPWSFRVGMAVSLLTMLFIMVLKNLRLRKCW